MSTADFDDVVSSQYELYQDDEDDNETDASRELAVSAMSDRLQSQNLAADDRGGNFDNEGDSNPMMASRSNQLTSSTSSLSSPWAKTAGSQTQRKRKSTSSRSHCANFARIHRGENNDGNVNKLMRKNITDEYRIAYQLTDKSEATGRQDSAGYFTADQLGSRNRRQNDTHHGLGQAKQETQMDELQFQLQSDPRSNRYSYKADTRHYRRQNELLGDVFQTESPEDPRYELEYAVQPIGHDKGFVFSQYYGQNETQYDTRPAKHYEKANFSRQIEMRPINRDENSIMSQNSSMGHKQASNAPRHPRHSGPHSDMPPSVYDESFQYSTGGKTDPQYAIRYGDVTSTFPHRTTTLPGVPIKTSPDDPDVDQHRETPPPTHSVPLPNSSGNYWSSSYAVGDMKDVGVWRADQLTAAEHCRSFEGHRPAASPLYESSNNAMTNFIKVEDSSNHDSASLLATSSSSPFCVDDRLRRDLLVERSTSQPRRRKRQNPGSSAAHAPASTSTLRFATPSSSTPASTGVGASSDVGRMPASLPFSLPPVPPGYRLVITHRPAPDATDDASQVTQLIIDHPSDSTTLIHSNTRPAVSQTGTSTDPTTPSTAVTNRRSRY